MKHRFSSQMVRICTVAGFVFAGFLVNPTALRADVIYRETFGRDPNNGGTGNINPSNFDWQRWNASGAVTGTTGSGVNGTDDGRPTDLPNVNAGAYYLNATPGPFARGWLYLDGTARLAMTTEFSINPADYVPGSIVFSWYQGNAALNQPFQVAVRVGGNWYASAQTFDNTAVATAAGFGTLPGGAGGSELQSFTFSTAAANWLTLSFTGDYDTNTHSGTASSALSLGGAPASDLAGSITGFGLYRNVTGSNGRIDSYTISATPIPPTIGKPVVWNGGVSGDWDAATFNWLNAGNLTNFSQGDLVLFDDSGINANINITALYSPTSITISNNLVNYVFGGGGGVAGTNTLVKQGSGALTLLTDNTYSGGTIISNGTINLGDGTGGSGTLGSGSIFNNGILRCNRTNNLTFASAISGAGTLIQDGTGTLFITGANSFSGSTIVNAGSLVLNGSLTGSLTNAPGTTLSGRGTNSGPISVAGNIAPGSGVGTITSGALTLASGATAEIEINSPNTVGGGVNDLLQVNGDLQLNNNTLTVVLLSKPQTGVPYRMINYTGTRSGSFNPQVTILGGSRFTATIDYATAGQVNLIFSGNAASLAWNGISSVEWDVLVSSNWLNQASSQPDAFADFDNVLFDDTPGISTFVDIADGVSVRPSGVTVNATNNSYVFFGNGSIRGTGGFTNLGPGTLELETPNAFSGGLTIKSGMVRLTHLTAAGTGPMNVYSNGIVVAGAAHTNAIVLSGGTLGASVGNISGFSGDLTAAPGTTSMLNLFDPQNPALNAELNFTGNLHGSGNLIVSSGGANTSVDSGVGFRLRGPVASDFSGTILISNNVKGELQTSVTTPFSPAGTGKLILVAGLYDGNNTLTAPAPGGFSELNIRNNSTNNAFLGNDVEISGTGLVLLNPLGSAPSNAVSVMGNLKISGGQELGVIRNSGQPQIVSFSSVTLTGGDVTFSPKTSGVGNPATVTGSDLSLSNITQIAPSGIIMSGLRTLFLTGSNGYTGNTTISNGVLALIGNSSLPNSPIISVVSPGSLSVTGRVGGALVLTSGQTLTGSGSVIGSIAAGSGSTVAPGDSVGTMNVSGTVLLQGKTVMEIDKLNNLWDSLQGAVSLTYGGTLVVSNLSSAFAESDSFPLFSAAAYNGSFAGILPATPGAGLAWNTNSLTSDGTLKVVAAGSTPPQITGVSASGGNLLFSGSGGPANGTYTVLVSTNVALPMSSWLPLSSGNPFDASGNFNFSTPILPGAGSQFFRLQVP